jgi:predicted enzyme related to lactoylglutathione lyase
MGERERHDHGTFSWVDLTTTDVDAAKSLYTDLFGWDYDDVPFPGGGGIYSMARLGARTAAAISPPQAPEQPPVWNSYVTVDDADAVAARAGELGGTVAMGPFDVGEAGRMAVIQDPAGAFFCIWQPRDSIGAEIVNGHGALTHNQLNTPDPEGAQAFYAGLFGWRFEQVSEDETPYWGIFNGERTNAGMMQLGPEFGPAPPHWLVFFGADDLDAATEKIEAAGGTILVPKQPVPGGEIVVAQDAQSAVFALFAGRFDD